MADVGGIAGDRLRSFIERIERLNEEKRALSEDIKEVFAEAKETGFDPKIMRKLIALRKRDASDVDEEESLLEVYKRALGMLADLPLGRAAMKEQFGEAASAEPAPEPKPKATPKTKSVKIETSSPPRDLGRAAGLAGRPGATNPYPVLTAERDAWQAAWIEAWNERRGADPEDDRSAAIAATLGHAARDDLTAVNPFRGGTVEADAWDEECEPAEAIA